MPNESKNKISVVIPVYKAAECLKELYERLIKSISKITTDYEIIMVEDCGGDGSWEIIKQLSDVDKNLKGIQLSRNFGQHHAITAGLEHNTGDWIIVMDCDLQDRPEQVLEFYSEAIKGYDIVLGRRTERQDNIFKILTSKLFWIIFGFLTDQNQDYAIGNFGIYSKKVIQNLLNLKEQNRFFPLSIKWLGFKSTTIDIKHASRFSGKSSYSFSKLMSLAISNILCYSNKPLKLMIWIGFITSLLSIIVGMFFIIKYLLVGSSVIGWSSVIVSLYFIGSIILMSVGIAGIYIDRVFNEVKSRPLYVINETLNLDDVDSL